MKNLLSKNDIHSLSVHIDKKRKYQILYLLLVTILAGLLEMLSIISIVPFVKLITAGENFAEKIDFILKFIEIKNKEDAIIITGLIFSFLYLANSLVRIFLIYITAKISQNITAELSVKVYKAKLYDSYINHISTSSSGVISAITQKIYQIGIVLSSFINLISGFFIFLSIIIILIFLDPKIISICLVFFGLLYFLIIFIGKKTIRRSSQIVNLEQNKIITNLQNGLGAIRDILIDKTQNFYTKIFEKSSFSKAKREAVLLVIQNSPRYILEGMAVALFVFLLIYWSRYSVNPGDPTKIFPTLAALAIGTQRILPLINQMYSQFTIIKSNAYQIKEVVLILNKSLERQEKKILIKKEKISFEKYITFKDIGFSYDGNKNIFENVNFRIRKGSRVGIIGKTGEGKSSFLDLLMGLLEPNKGNIYIDDNKLSPLTNDSWQSKISHVPQKIFLSDSSFLENIAFGEELNEIKIKRVEMAAKKAQIHDFITKSENQYMEQVGERGVRLSGGQIQRIALARALYKKSEVIIFDEATNSLDHETEKLVMQELNSLDANLTVIIVAHRLNTLSSCDEIYEIKDKQLLKISL